MELCFLKKYTAVISFGKQNITSSILTILSVIFNQSCIILLIFALPTKEEELKLIPEEYKYYFDHLEDYLICEFNIMIITFLASVPTGSAFITGVIIFTTYKMLKVLSHSSSTNSNATIKRHRDVLRSLIAQSLTVVIFVVSVIIVVFTIALELPAANEITSIQTAIFSNHSIVNCIVMIFSYPPFRNEALFWKNRKDKKSSSVSKVVVIN
ncbi:unnamed protein product [Caenorhabditis angaria]|uniref:Uncharacterized protein n=1 Tax=Caenorhabditis angaria TaxID=860376 RepID=A0A9P1NCX6_9PELO|nr:unnamed protein product [Caenorhabditis angaria]